MLNSRILYIDRCGFKSWVDLYTKDEEILKVKELFDEKIKSLESEVEALKYYEAQNSQKMAELSQENELLKLKSYSRVKQSFWSKLFN